MRVPGSGSIPGRQLFCEHAVDDDGDRIRSDSEIEDVVARARIWMKTRLDAIMVIDEISDISDLTRECVSDVIGRAELQMVECQDFCVVPQFFQLRAGLAKLRGRLSGVRGVVPTAVDSGLFALARGDRLGATTRSSPMEGEYSTKKADFPRGRARDIIGKMVEVYWAADDAWYEAIVLGLSRDRHPALKYAVVKYTSDGIISWEDARQGNVFFQVNSII
eukprot:SAG11_NODE_2023_length_3910_cov_3.261349_5_plen_220_part_00